MKSRLNKFSSFASCILPHEANFLLEYKKFEDSEKSSIVDTMIYNAALIENYAAYNDAIDKRKYSYIKNWCIKLLDSLDVDKTLEKLLVCTKKTREMVDFITGNSVMLSAEKELILASQCNMHCHIMFVRLARRHYCLYSKQKTGAAAAKHARYQQQPRQQQQPAGGSDLCQQK